MQAEAADGAGEPRWQRIVDFPLVAMLIAIVLFVGVSTLAQAIDGQLPPMPPNLRQAAVTVITVGSAFAMYKLAIRHLGERRQDDLPGRGAPAGIGLGLLIGAALFSAVVGIAALGGFYRITGCCSTSGLIYDLCAPAITVGFTEELLFRGILFRWIEEFGGSWAALVVTSALFGLAHLLNPNATWFSSFAIATEAGILLGGAYMLTRSLWMPMALHAAWNFVQGFVFAVPVSGVAENGLVTARLSGDPLFSGGGFGLEASIIAVVIATGAGIVLVVMAVRKGELMQPSWVRRRIAA